MIETLFTDYWKGGIAEGKAEGLAEAVLLVFASRRLHVTKAQRARILKRSDQKILRRWLKRAVTTSVADVLREPATREASNQPPPNRPDRRIPRAMAFPSEHPLTASDWKKALKLPIAE